MSWQALIFVSILFGSFSTLLQRVLLKEDKSDPVGYAIFFQLLVGGMITAFGVSQKSFSLSNLQPFIPTLILMAILYSAGNILFFKAMKRAEASETIIIFSSRAIFTILASSVFLEETLNQKQLLGIALIFISIVVISYKAAKFTIGKPQLITLLAAFCYGLASTNDRVLVKNIALYPFTSLAFVAPAILTLISYPQKVRKMIVFFNKEFLLKVLILCVAYTISAITFFAALASGPTSSQVVTINLTGVIVTVLLAVIFLKERTYLGRKLFGALLCIAGLTLIS